MTRHVTTSSFKWESDAGHTKKGKGNPDVDPFDAKVGVHFDSCKLEAYQRQRNKSCCCGMWRVHPLPMLSKRCDRVKIGVGCDVRNDSRRKHGMRLYEWFYASTSGNVSKPNFSFDFLSIVLETKVDQPAGGCSQK